MSHSTHVGFSEPTPLSTAKSNLSFSLLTPVLRVIAFTLLPLYILSVGVGHSPPQLPAPRVAIDGAN